MTRKGARAPVRCGLLAVVIAMLAGCAALRDDVVVPDDEQPVEIRPLEILAKASLEIDGEGLATRVRLVLSLAPKDPVPLEVESISDGPANDAIVEVRLQWKDFFGVEPTSVGRSRTLHLPYGPDGTGSRTAPLERRFELILEDPDPRSLARRITVDAVLRPLDIVQGVARSAGAAVPFPRSTVSTFGLQQTGSLDELLAAEPPRDPATLFVAGARSGLEHPTPTLEVLVDALEQVDEREREALFGALLFLTGETNFRSVPHWRAWLAAREAAEDDS